MTKRIFHTVFMVAIGVFAASAMLFMTVLYDYFSAVQQNQLRIQTDLVARGVENESIRYLEGLSPSQYRITWIAADGSVLFDSASSANSMENHLAREEVETALAEGYGASIRTSSTLTKRYLYSAKRLSDKSVLRLSVTQHSLLVLTFGMLQPIAVIFLIAIILSAILAYRLSKSIVKPLNQLNLNQPLDNPIYPELSPLLRRIDTQQEEIKHQHAELEKKKTDFEALISSIPEGIVLLDGEGIIQSINPVAEKLLQAASSCVGKHIQSIDRTGELNELIAGVENGTHTETILTLEGKRYQVEATLAANHAILGIVLLFLNVTEKEKAEQLRREFTANVSHELKTPLHTISGSAEMLANGMVKPADISTFAGHIYTEAQRMICLVEDILKLSHLDEGAHDMQWETLDLYPLAEETINTLMPLAKKSGISLKLYGKNAEVYGIRQLLQGLIFNLCSNAIQYNRPNGSVSVEIEDYEAYVALVVSDTGIGIPPQHQERIFERFYRVDKSHSKEMGGTGLGLSIVKHTVRLHHGEIDLQSVPDESTTICVRLPAHKM